MVIADTRESQATRESQDIVVQVFLVIVDIQVTQEYLVIVVTQESLAILV